MNLRLTLARQLGLLLLSVLVLLLMVSNSVQGQDHLAPAFGPVQGFGYH